MPPKQSGPPRPRGRPPGKPTAASGSGSSRPRTKNTGAVQKRTGKSVGARKAAAVVNLEDDSDVEIQSAGREEGDSEEDQRGTTAVEDDDDDEEPPRCIPPELVTRLLHEAFDKEGTRITKSANVAVAKYFDTFVREAIARAMAERRAGFLDVEDLERMAPQLLLDL